MNGLRQEGYKILFIIKGVRTIAKSVYSLHVYPSVCHWTDSYEI